MSENIAERGFRHIFNPSGFSIQLLTRDCHEPACVTCFWQNCVPLCGKHVVFDTQPDIERAMPFGINLRTSGDTAPYWELVERASALEIEPTIRALGYPPHITLAKYDDADVEELQAVVADQANVPGLTISFDRIGVFDPGFLILWASPKPHEALMDLHNRVHAIIDPVRCKPPYRPGSWTPHCSIALRVADSHRDAAHQLLATDFTPFVLKFDVVDCVSSPPIEVITERVLIG